MIDWVSGYICINHDRVPTDRLIKISPDLEIISQKSCLFEVPGSHDSNFRIRSAGSDIEGNPDEIYFTGNPSKFLQGHNLFGSDCLVPLMRDVFSKAFDALNITPTPEEQARIEEGDYRLTRVDVNYSFELQSKSDVIAWIKAASLKSKSRHGTNPQLKGHTLYYGQHSKRWSIKAYSKAQEIEAKGHKLPIDLQMSPLPEWAENKLRMEVTLRTKELEKRELRNAKDWDRETPQIIFNDYISRINMNEQMALTDKQVHQLPQMLKSTYLLWQQGFNVRDHVTERTYYRHKKQLIDGYGIDITLPQQSKETTNVIPLIRVLEAKPATIPEWAYRLKLIHHSAA